MGRDSGMAAHRTRVKHPERAALVGLIAGRARRLEAERSLDELAGLAQAAGAHGTGFGVLTSASLVGMASSPFIAGFLGGSSIRVVFLVDVVVMAALAGAVHKLMVD